MFEVCAVFIGGSFLKLVYVLNRIWQVENSHLTSLRYFSWFPAMCMCLYQMKIFGVVSQGGLASFDCLSLLNFIILWMLLCSKFVFVIFFLFCLCCTYTCLLKCYNCVRNLCDMCIILDVQESGNPGVTVADAGSVKYMSVKYNLSMQGEVSSVIFQILFADVLMCRTVSSITFSFNFYVPFGACVFYLPSILMS